MLLFMFAACTAGGGQEESSGFVTIKGHDLIKPNGEKLLIQGTNLGNWLNPEGYMFGFGRTNSAWMIDLLFKEAVGPDFTAEFWQQFKDNYVTREDITPSACRSTTSSSPTKTIWGRQAPKTAMSASTPW